MLCLTCSSCRQKLHFKTNPEPFKTQFSTTIPILVSRFTYRKFDPLPFRSFKYRYYGFGRFNICAVWFWSFWEQRFTFGYKEETNIAVVSARHCYTRPPQLHHHNVLQTFAKHWIFSRHCFCGKMTSVFKNGVIYWNDMRLLALLAMQATLQWARRSAAKYRALRSAWIPWSANIKKITNERFQYIVRHDFRPFYVSVSGDSSRCFRTLQYFFQSFFVQSLWNTFFKILYRTGYQVVMEIGTSPNHNTGLYSPDLPPFTKVALQSILPRIDFLWN